MAKKDQLSEKIGKKIDERLAAQSDEKIDKEITESIDEDIKDIIKQKARKRLERKQIIKSSPTSEGSFGQIILNFRRFLSLCWQGICQPISWIMLATYIIIGLLLLTYSVPSAPFCSGSGSTYLTAIFIALLSIVAIILISIFSSYSKTALIFSVLLNIPIVIIIIFSLVNYLALVVVAGIFLGLITQVRK